MQNWHKPLHVEKPARDPPSWIFHSKAQTCTVILFLPPSPSSGNSQLSATRLGVRAEQGWHRYHFGSRFLSQWKCFCTCTQLGVLSPQTKLNVCMQVYTFRGWSFFCLKIQSPTERLQVPLLTARLKWCIQVTLHLSFPHPAPWGQTTTS